MKPNLKANKWHPWNPAKMKVCRETRQQVRAYLRAKAFGEVTAQYGGEKRSERRKMATAKGNRDYRTMRGLSEPTQ